VVAGARVILSVPDRWAEIALGMLTIGLGVYSLLRKELGQEFRLRHEDPRGLLIGGYLGAHLSISKGNRWIKRGFEAVTLLVGLKLIAG
jgi:hypothetical protein